MPDLQTLLSQIREDLQDTSVTPRHSDERLTMYLRDAILDYSQFFPYRQAATLAGSGSTFALPEDFISDITVESPRGYFLERRPTRPGIKYIDLDVRPLWYYIDGDSLYTVGYPSDDVYLTYNSLHALPEDHEDDEWICTVPVRDYELLRLYVQAKVYGIMRGKQSNLDRFKLGSGKRDDNPLEPEVSGLMDEYYRKIGLRQKVGAVYLHRTGRNR